MDKNLKNNPFKTPENYFGSLEDRLKERISGGLSTLPQEDGFNVPDGYFKDIHAKIMDRLESGERKVISIHRYKKYYYLGASIAAALLIALLINLGAGDQHPSFDDLVHSDIEAYFQDNEIELTSYELAEVIPIDQLEVYDIIENQLGEEQMVDYLNENIEDLESLNLEYDE